MKFIKIEWVDTWTESGWHSESYFDFKPIPCTSVGILVKEDKDCIAIAQNYGEMGDCRWGDVTNIPKCAIKKVRELK